MPWFKCFAIGVSLTLTAFTAHAADAIKIGTQKTGTVGWELDVIKKYGLDAKHGVSVDVVDLASNESAKIAFNAGEIDMFVTDWLFVSRERTDGNMITFVPFSASVGSLVVKGDGAIKSLADLKGKKIGVVGGAVDKSWLLLQGYAKKNGVDLASSVTPVFGAPPLLNEKFLSGELDAVLTNWNFVARLTPKGAKELVTVQQAQEALGAKGAIATIGFAFKDDFAAAHRDAIRGFLAADKDAKEILKTSDPEWARLRAVMKIDDNAVFDATVAKFRAGIPTQTPAEDQKTAAALYDVLVQVGGKPLVGSGTKLADGTFWPGLLN